MHILLFCIRIVPDAAGGYYYPVCDANTCKRSCLQHLGYSVQNGAICYNNECYCKEADQTTKKVDDTPARPEYTTEEGDHAIIEEWNYNNQESTSK